jgi:hypothetical protein
MKRKAGMKSLESMTEKEIRANINITKMSIPKKYKRIAGRGTDKKFAVDKYPAKDQFIPIAEFHADKIYPDKSATGYLENWTACYCAEMDRLLSEAGLRLL